MTNTANNTASTATGNTLDWTGSTKADLRNVLTMLSVEGFSAKANHATLLDLVQGLDLNDLYRAGVISDEEFAQHTPAAPAPRAPVTTKPVQVAPGLKIEKDREERNGIKRPSIGGRCRAVWDALDAYRDETNELPTAKVVAALAADEGWNPNNASIEFYQWRKFNGITGRAAKVAAPVADA